MKTINAVLGSILVILGVVSLGGSAIVVSGTCAKTAAAAALLHVPTCEQTTATFFVLLILGVAFLIVGAILLLKGRQRVPRPREVEPSSIPPPIAALFCRNCGKQMPPGSLYCDRCGTKLA